MPSGRKEEFNDWLKSVFYRLNGEYVNLELELYVDNLKNNHWYKLWRIFEEHIESPHQGAKEQLLALDEAHNDASAVILSAHNKCRSELDFDLQMDHYMNSGKYD
jgi:hypothetical protein